MSLLDATSDGDRLKSLAALRDLLASAIDDCDSMRDLAALAARLQSVLVEIDVIKPVEQKGDAVDEIAKRRAARRSGATSDSPRAKRSS